jgi:large subunit ribosomal protein L25
MSYEIKATKRLATGTGASRRLRNEGTIPAILYGAGQAAEMLNIEHKTMFYAIKNENFHTQILTLDIEGKKESVLLRDFQLHPFKPLVLHADFERIDQNKPIRVKLPLHFINAEISPAVKLQASRISYIVQDIDVRVLPGKMPEFITVDLSTLAAGSSVLLADIQLPEGVESLLLTNGKNITIANVAGKRA